MSNRVGIHELATVLARKNKITIKEAESFVVLMFDNLNQGLNLDKQVKVKGLGTFKVMSVNARKSVDVNTGRPIIIDGRDKISFTPDPVMRDLVNRPFAQFDTMIINDGVEFEELNELELNPNDEPQDIASENENIEKKKEQMMDTDIKLPNATNEQAINVNAFDEQETLMECSISSEQLHLLNADISTLAVGEHEKEREKQREQASILAAANTTVSVSGKPVDVESLLAEERKKAEAIITSYKDDIEDLWEEHDHHKKWIQILILLLVVLLLGAAGAAWYFMDQIHLRDNRIEHLELLLKNSKTMTKDAQATSTANTDLVLIEESSQTQQTDDHPSTSQSVKKTVVSQLSVASQKSKSNQLASNSQPTDKSYDADPRIRTGAYRIVGISQTVKAVKGQSLHSIGNTYLGAGMECYIEAVNGGNIDVREGQKIKIPKLQLKKHKK